MPYPPVAEDIMDVLTLSAYLGVTPETLYNWRSLGKPCPPAFKVGSRLRWRRESVDAWIAEQEAKSS